jgi:hypothetical protein
MTIKNLEQILILLFSGIAISLFASKKRKTRQAGFIIAICGQPLWWHTTWVHEQWGIFILSLWYTLNHLRGILNNRHGG